MKYEIKLEFAGCMMPVHEIAKGFGLNVKKSYPSREQAQSVCDHVAIALIAFGKVGSRSRSTRAARH